MKKIALLVFVSTFSFISTFAQDVIVKKDGSTILSKVLEVNQDNIKYKKFSNQNGPTYTINIADIMAINYENGDKDTFDAQNISNNNQTAQNNDGPKYIEKIPDERNAELINLYKTDCTLRKKIPENGTKATACYAIWYIAPSSVLSNEDVEIKFTRQSTEISPSDNKLLNGGTGIAYGHIFVYSINILNKTNNTIYIDKGNCFRILDKGGSYCYFDQQVQTTVSHGSGSGASLGLGSVAGVLGVGGAVGALASGVAVGGGSTNSVSKTYSQQRIMAIPPHGNLNLTTFRKSEIGTKIIVEHGEYFFPRSNQNPPGKRDFKTGEIFTYDENTSPWKRHYIITYSRDSEFNTYSTMKINMYIQRIIGTRNTTWNTDCRTYIYNYGKYLNGITDYTIIDWGSL